jgi:hypothetical protein
MSGTPKDSPEVMTFMALFAEVKKICGDQPEALAGLAGDDQQVRNLCVRLHSLATDLVFAEASHSEAFAVSVRKTFRTAWRDFQDRYHEPIFYITICAFREDGDGGEVYFSHDAFHKQAPHMAFAVSDIVAQEAFIALEKSMLALEVLKEQTSETGLEIQANDGATLRLDIGNALESWQLLRDTVGLDIRTAFRRRQLLPFTLVPDQVPVPQPENGRLSLLKHLADAQNAFVFGSTLAALGLMRSIMESTLRDYYHAPGSTIEQFINNATGLPDLVSPARLHFLRTISNDVLHLSNSARFRRTSLNGERMEREVISLFRMLRDLIEGIPEGSKR